MTTDSQPGRAPAQPDDLRNYGAGAIFGQIVNALKTGWNHAVSLLAALRVSVAFAKTDVTARRGLEITSSEASTQAGLFFNLTGGAAQANRLVDLFLAENGVSFGGGLRLQQFGGYTQIGGTTGGVDVLTVTSGTTNAPVTIWDANGHIRLTQALPPTGVLGTGAGTGAGTAPVLTIAGDDHHGTIQVATGTQVPAAGAAIVSVSFKTAMTTAPKTLFVHYANGNAQALARTQDPIGVSPTTTGWTLNAGTAALAISTTYVWYYWVF